VTQGKPFIRPEDAQSMLREATPGPWQARGDGPSAGHPHFYICTCEDRAHVAENVYYGNARLLTYAPDLAELVANMRYEYAVQVEEFPGIWRFLHSSGESTGGSTAAAWSKNFEMAPTPLANYRYREPTRSRIVRRLVGDVEVAE